MNLFQPDLYRSFAIGFVLGSALLAGVMASKSEQGLAGEVIPAASAAPLLADQTLIAPIHDQTR